MFQGLSVPVSDASNAEAFSSTPIGEHTQWHIGRSIRGLPAVLVEVESGQGSERPLTVGLENLRIEHNVRCQITCLKNKSTVARYSIIQCLTTDEEVQACFLRTIAGTIAGFGGRVEARDLTELVNRLVALFRLVRRPRMQTIQGLWAELFLILSASDSSRMIDAWHSDPVERFDFSQRDQRIEVKSNSSRSRDHVFSFEQVYPPSGASVLIASIHVEKQVNGATLGELWNRVSDAARDADGRMKVERVCIESLGEDLAIGRASAFDSAVAADSLEFYSVNDIPRPPRAMPSGVSQVQFRSDLSLTEPVAVEDIHTAANLHRNCIGIV